MATRNHTLLDISKATHRRNLKPRAEPYWRTLAKGCAVGVRIGVKGESWIARFRSPGGKQEYNALKDAHDYDTAERLARRWFDQMGKGIVTGLTVEDACRSYIDQVRIEKDEERASDAEGRYRRRIYGTAFGNTPCGQLTPQQVLVWRDGLLEAVSKQSANRDLKALKAALNRAFRLGLVESDRAWKTVQGFPNVDNSRVDFLDLDGRRALLAAAGGAIRNMIEACLHTAARPIEIRRANVDDFDQKERTLTLIGYKGRDGTLRKREVPLSPAAVAFFARMADGKNPSAPLVPNDSGERWRRSEHTRHFIPVRDKAGLPGTVTLYVIRHSIIAEWLVSGIDPLTVCKVAGTGMEMLERNYSKLIRAKVADRFAAVEVI